MNEYTYRSNSCDADFKEYRLGHRLDIVMILFKYHVNVGSNGIHRVGLA